LVGDDDSDRPGPQHSVSSEQKHARAERAGEKTRVDRAAPHARGDGRGRRGWSSDPTRKRLHATEEIWAGEWDPHRSDIWCAGEAASGRIKWAGRWSGVLGLAVGFGPSTGEIFSLFLS
jgi:hypothetical protein